LFTVEPPLTLPRTDSRINVTIDLVKRRRQLEPNVDIARKQQIVPTAQRQHDLE